MRPISGLSALSGMTARDGLSSPRQAGSGARFLGLRDGLSCATPSRPGPLRFDEQELQEGVECSHRAHFSAPAKRLRAEHRPAAGRTATSRTVSSPATEEPSSTQHSDTTYRAIRARKVTDMQTNTTIEPPGSAAPGIVPEPVRVRRDAEATPATARHQPNPASMVLAKLLSVIRGDKYMADAYPPDGPPGAATHAKDR